MSEFNQSLHDKIMAEYSSSNNKIKPKSDDRPKPNLNGNMQPSAPKKVHWWHKISIPADHYSKVAWTILIAGCLVLTCGIAMFVDNGLTDGSHYKTESIVDHRKAIKYNWLSHNDFDHAQEHLADSQKYNIKSEQLKRSYIRVPFTSHSYFSF